jgi:hypothetical protein
MIHIDSGYTIGQKRNFACERARGEVVAHWDDDDWSAPKRLEEQLLQLQNSKRAVVAYSTMLFTDGARWWRYHSDHPDAIGTSLCYRRDWWAAHRFRARQIGEDGDFSREAQNAGQLSLVPCQDQIVASVHRGNTSARELSLICWKPVEAPAISGIQSFLELAAA